MQLVRRKVVTGLYEIAIKQTGEVVARVQHDAEVSHAPWAWTVSSGWEISPGNHAQHGCAIALSDATTHLQSMARRGLLVHTQPQPEHVEQLDMEALADVVAAAEQELERLRDELAITGSALPYAGVTASLREEHMKLGGATQAVRAWMQAQG